MPSARAVCRLMANSNLVDVGLWSLLHSQRIKIVVFRGRGRDAGLVVANIKLSDCTICLNYAAGRHGIGVAALMTSDNHSMKGTTAMSNKLARGLACSVLGSLLSISAQAFPVSTAPKQGATPVVTLVGNFCGLNFHRTPDGYCVRNGAFYIAPPPAPVQVVAPLGCPYGFELSPDGRCFAPLACTNGYYLGPYGQCFPYWRPWPPRE
jgi:hypothetical protein